MIIKFPTNKRLRNVCGMSRRINEQMDSHKLYMIMTNNDINDRGKDYNRDHGHYHSLRGI